MGRLPYKTNNGFFVYLDEYCEDRMNVGRLAVQTYLVKRIRLGFNKIFSSVTENFKAYENFGGSPLKEFLYNLTLKTNF